MQTTPSTHGKVQESPAWNWNVRGDGTRVYVNINRGTVLGPIGPRLGGDILASGARHIQAARERERERVNERSGRVRKGVKPRT
jgi:hypothetical protein